VEIKSATSFFIFTLKKAGVNAPANETTAGQL
jgi:hypothetical protein